MTYYLQVSEIICIQRTKWNVFKFQGNTSRLTSSTHDSPLRAAVKHTETLSETGPTKNIQACDQIEGDNSSLTATSKQKSPKCRTTEKDLEENKSIDPLANSPLLLQEKNSSNSNANEYNSADSEKDALIMSKTSSNF